MDRETRYNLWFLIVIVIILAPGAVILVRKKLDPAAKPMYLPDAMPRQAAYNDAMQTNPRLERAVPPMTGQWVMQLAQQHWPRVKMVGPEKWYEGLASTRRYFEVVVSAVDAQGVLRLGIVTWDPAMTGQPSALRFAVDGEPMKVSVFNTYAVPKDVRKELQGFRFVNPPLKVGWVELSGETAWQAGVIDDESAGSKTAQLTVEAMGEGRRQWGDSVGVPVK